MPDEEEPNHEAVSAPNATFEKFGQPPDRDEDPEGWLKWRNQVWADAFHKVGTTLEGMAVLLDDNEITHEHDVALGCILEGVQQSVNNAHSFFMQEAYVRGAKMSREMLAAMTAAAESAGVGDEIDDALKLL